MKDMMVGFAGTGKTSYMGAMYQRFSGEGIGGFSIGTTSQSDHTALCRIGKQLEKGIYPANTDIKDKYYFYLRYNGQDVLDFTWTDYRGAVLAEHSEEMRELVKEITEADALIIFLDGPSFTSKEREQEAMKILKFSKSLISNTIKARSSNDGVRFPVAFVITKMDEIKFDAFADSPVAKLLSENLIADISENKNIQGLLTWTAVGEQNLNIEDAFLFAMCFGLQIEIKAAEQALETAKCEMDYYAENSGVWDSFKATLSGGSSNWERCQRKYKEALAIAEKLDCLVEPCNCLIEVLNEWSKSEDALMRLF